MFETNRPLQFFLLSCVTAVACSLIFGAQHSWILIGCCIVILIAGLPHGAFDIYIVANLFQNRAFVLAIAGYLSLIAGTVMLWWGSPDIFLLAFLSYSAFHFGDSDWPTAPTVHKIFWGITIIALPCLFANQQVTLLFTLILNAEPPSLITSGLGYLAIPAALFCSLKTKTHQPNLTTPILLIAYALVCIIGGALLAFTCYFAFLHGPHHLQRWRFKLPNSGNSGVYLLSFSVFAIILVLVVLAPQLSPNDPWVLKGSSIDSSAIRYTFVALAALTVPHMTFLYIAGKRG